MKKELEIKIITNERFFLLEDWNGKKNWYNVEQYLLQTDKQAKKAVFDDLEIKDKDGYYHVNINDINYRNIKEKHLGK